MRVRRFNRTELQPTLESNGLVKKIWGDDCGCDERQDDLNDIELW